MRRLWFKEEMRAAILQGTKTCTTRYHELKKGQQYRAVSGSRFKAKPFAVIKILTSIPTNWGVVTGGFYMPEGFKSQFAMTKYLIKNDLIRKDFDDLVFSHSFEVVERIA